jgi:hypothetical protein
MVGFMEHVVTLHPQTADRDSRMWQFAMTSGHNAAASATPKSFICLNLQSFPLSSCLSRSQHLNFLLCVRKISSHRRITLQLHTQPCLHFGCRHHGASYKKRIIVAQKEGQQRQPGRESAKRWTSYSQERPKTQTRGTYQISNGRL